MELWGYISHKNNYSVRAFNYKSFASLCSVYFGAAPIPKVQDAILNLPNPYLRGTTEPLD